jgi:cytochrome P450
VPSTPATPSGPRARFPGHLRFALRSDPLRFLTRLARDYGDFVPFRMGRLPFFLVNDPEAIREVLVGRNDDFTKSPALREAKVTLGEGLLTSEGDFHRRQRRLSQPAFHPHRVAAYAGVFVRYTREAAAVWRAGEPFDVHEEMMRLTLRVVAKTLFDADVQSDAAKLGEAMAVLVRMFRRATNPFAPILNRLPLPSNFRFLKALGLVRGTVERFIRERRQGGVDRGDLLSMLIRARDVGGGEVSVDAEGTSSRGAAGNGDAAKMSDVQLRDEIFTLFTAGHETTANALTFTWHLLGTHPGVEAKVHEEVDRVLAGRDATAADVERLPYLRAVLSESLRLYPPAWIVTRQARHDTTVAGRPIPAGGVIMMSQWVTHHDARWWPDADKFDPARWLEDGHAAPAAERPRYAYYPFGGGPRNCIGEAFARMEAMLIVATIAQKWRLELVDRTDPALAPTITLRPKNPLMVVPRERAGTSA